MNLQLVNGSGGTGDTPSGEGNFIIGYTTPVQRPQWPTGPAPTT